MSCTDYEEMIYTFHELGKDEQGKVKQHLETCEACIKLLEEVERFSQLVKKMNQQNQSLTPPASLVNKVLDTIGSKKVRQVSERSNLSLLLSISRYSLAAVSCGILVLFFMEILVPDLKSGKIKGPITNVQGAIIKSEDFRKVFTRPKEKKSLFDDCKNILSQNVDANCVREKLDKINF